MSIEQAGNPGRHSTPAADTSGFRDPTTLTRWLKILLWVGIALTVISLGSSLLELKLLRDLQAAKRWPPESLTATTCVSASSAPSGSWR